MTRDDKKLFNQLLRQRRLLINAIEECQSLFGQAKGIYQDDRSPDRAGKLVPVLEKGFNICLEVRDICD